MKHRVFFADEAAAITAGYRPCAVCMPQEYAAWKKAQPAKIAQAASDIRKERAMRPKSALPLQIGMRLMTIWDAMADIHSSLPAPHPTVV